VTTTPFIIAWNLVACGVATARLDDVLTIAAWERMEVQVNSSSLGVSDARI
jgi:hypothetical protein